MPSGGEVMGIGEKLADLLKIKNIRPGTLASETGIPKSTIYSIIKRDTGKVSYSVIETIADALGVPVEYFIDTKKADKSSAAALSADEIRMIELWRSADQTAREYAMMILSKSAEEQEAKKRKDLA
jgi:transcriptional regulator with XRE-family HTH domain